MSRPRTALFAALVFGALVAGLGAALGGGQGDERESMVVLKHGTSGSGARWELRYRDIDGQDCLELAIDGAEPNVACGFDIPGTTEVGFGGGLKPGQGDFYLFGLTSARVTSVVADSPEHDSQVQTQALPADADRPTLRFFILVREPVDNVVALVALDADGKLVQRLELPAEPE